MLPPAVSTTSATQPPSPPVTGSASFTLPVPDGPRGREAARQCVLGWGFRDCGPRITNKLAVELGYDVGFGRGASANDVASFIVRRMVERARGA